MIPQSEALSLKKLNISPDNSGHINCFQESNGKSGRVRVGSQRYRSMVADPADLSAIISSLSRLTECTETAKGAVNECVAERDPSLHYKREDYRQEEQSDFEPDNCRYRCQQPDRVA